MLSSLDNYSLMGLGVVAILVLYVLVWIVISRSNGRSVFQQMFCPDDPYDCDCRSCRLERE